MQCTLFHLILGINFSLGIKCRGARLPASAIIGSAVSAKKNASLHYRASDTQNDNLAALCLFLFFLFFSLSLSLSLLSSFLIISGAAEAQCESWLSFTAGLQPP